MTLDTDILASPAHERRVLLFAVIGHDSLIMVEVLSLSLTPHEVERCCEFLLLVTIMRLASGLTSGPAPFLPRFNLLPS